LPRRPSWPESALGSTGRSRPSPRSRRTTSAVPVLCLSDTEATFTAKHTVRVTRTRAGKATAFRGNSKVTIEDCSIATFINYTLKGTLDN
jgi:hypothetical protein